MVHCSELLSALLFIGTRQNAERGRSAGADLNNDNLRISDHCRVSVRVRAGVRVRGLGFGYIAMTAISVQLRIGSPNGSE